MNEMRYQGVELWIIYEDWRSVSGLDELRPIFAAMSGADVGNDIPDGEILGSYVCR